MRPSWLTALHGLVGIVAASGGDAPGPPYSPYANDAANAIYNLLFCDGPSDYAAKPGEPPTPWQAALAASPADVPALEALAADPGQEGRIRFLAFQRLRAIGRSVVPKQLLGVIVEVRMEGGLDTLAAYRDGGVRYLNQSSRLVAGDGVPSFRPLVGALFTAAEAVVAQIGPWPGQRRAPPAGGDVRLTFLVSDGLYFGEGPLVSMQQEPMAAPVLARATALLVAVVAAGTG